MDDPLGRVGRDACGLQRWREGCGALDGRRHGSRHRPHHECGVRGFERRFSLEIIRLVLRPHSTPITLILLYMTIAS